MEPRIQYTQTADGVSIAYSTAGTGRPMIGMPVPGFSHAELSWRMFAAILPPLAARYHLVTYDARGTGLSDRGAIDFSMDAMLRDLEAVVERCGFDSFALAAWISAAPIAVTYAANHPDRVSHLIISDGWTEFADLSESVAYKAGAPLLEADWVLFTETFAQVLWAYQNPEFGRLFAEFMRACCEPEAMRAGWASWRTYDATRLLARVKAPTLVVQNKNSRWFGLEIGRRLASGIPNARLALIDDVTYAPLPDLIHEFIGDDDESAAPAADRTSGIHTILFTDVEGSTALTRRLGDAAARELLREHERLTRDALKAHGGAEVKTMGDGFMASFPSASRALDCAIALQRAFAERNESAAEPIHVRVGLNAGEPIEEEADLFGTAVILAARIAAQAQGGEILVSEGVRQIVAGKKFLLADRGAVTLRGFEDPVHVYDLSWRE
jgi:class 3 adenylate cyclase